MLYLILKFTCVDIACNLWYNYTNPNQQKQQHLEIGRVAFLIIKS